MQRYTFFDILDILTKKINYFFNITLVKIFFCATKPTFAGYVQMADQTPFILF